MNIEQEITKRIQQELKPLEFELINQSDKHNGHSGDNGTGQSHFRLIVISECFDGLNRVQCHKKINDLLKDLFDYGLHALSISAKSK